MSNLIESKIDSVRFHAAANIGPLELNSVQVGKNGVTEIVFAVVGNSCVGILVFSKSPAKEYRDIVPMGDITRIRLSDTVAKVEKVKANA